LGTDDFYKILGTEGEIIDGNDKYLANTIYDNLKNIINRYNETKSDPADDVIIQNIVNFVDKNYNNGFIYIDKVNDGAHILKIQKLYNPTNTVLKEDSTEEYYKIFNDDNIQSVLDDLKSNGNNSIIFYRKDGNIVNKDLVMGKMIIDFCASIKNDENVLTEYKQWISEEIMKYYVIFFINLFIDKYYNDIIQEQTLITLLNNLRLATIGNYRELNDFKKIILDYIVKYDSDKIDELKQIINKISDATKIFAVTTNRISHKCDEPANIAGLQNIIFFSYMFLDKFEKNDAALSKLKHITKTWKKIGYISGTGSTENCDDTIATIIKGNTHYIKGFETYIKDLEYKIDNQKVGTGNVNKIEIYDNFLEKINFLENIDINIKNSIKVMCEKFLKDYREYDETYKTTPIGDLKKYKKVGKNYDEIFTS
jgi:hypothetical protein